MVACICCIPLLMISVCMHKFKTKCCLTNLPLFIVGRWNLRVVFGDYIISSKFLTCISVAVIHPWMINWLTPLPLTIMFYTTLICQWAVIHPVLVQVKTLQMSSLWIIILCFLWLIFYTQKMCQPQLQAKVIDSQLSSFLLSFSCQERYPGNISAKKVKQE